MFFSILCKDQNANDGKVVKISYDKEPEYTAQDVLNLFKRFEVILTTEELQDCEIVN